MKNSLFQEVLISLALVILMILFLNPFNFWMPNNLLMLMVLISIVIFSIFTSFIWKENAKDERESLHRMLAGRFAFLAGAAVLVIGIVVQSFEHNVNIWLVLALAAMVITKIIALVYSRLRY